MVGGYFDTHPWGITTAKIRVERPDFPGMSGYLADPEVRDEHYQYMNPYSRDKVDVLASIDVSSVDLNHPNVHRADGDFPIAWIKTYGKGRVFASHLGHGDAMWDDARMQRMYLEAIKWAVGMTDYPVRPHPKP
jgi:type 1 glutamine amidotransferase